MPPSATIEAIKAYQAKVEKNKITSAGLLPCPVCRLDPEFFKIHAYRERRFLLIVEMLIKAIYCTLVRFRCPHCGKTFTYYPEFALPHKHYTRQTIEKFSNTYVEDDQKTYDTSVMTPDGVPAYPDDQGSLSGTTIYRWISTLAQIAVSLCEGNFSRTHDKPHEANFNDSPDFAISVKKYRSAGRKAILSRCRSFLNPENHLKIGFSPSLQGNALPFAL